MYDTIIVGGGPAGLTAAMYTCRKRMKTLVLTVDIGGQTNLAPHIENYPGHDVVDGIELMKTYQKQAEKFGAEIIFGKVMKISKEKDIFTIEMADKTKYQGKTIILTHGKVPKTLGIPGEEEFTGKGVSTCVTCDAPLFQDKIVAVVGGGNSALEGAMDLAHIAKKVYLVHRRDELRADEYSVERAKKEKKIHMVLSSAPVEVVGDKTVKKLVIEDVNSKEKKELDVDGIFIEVGYTVDNTMIEGLVKLNKSNEVIVNEKCETSCKGVFAAGDVTSIQFKQTIIAAGEGSKAALSAHAFLRGVTTPSIDWIHYFKR